MNKAKHTKPCAAIFAHETVCVNGLMKVMTNRQDAERKLDELRLKRLRDRGERLKEERKRLGLTLAEFANILGIHRNTQGNYEAGREPPSDYLAAAQEAGVDVAYVMDGGRTLGATGLCASAVQTIFERAAEQGLTDLDPHALSVLSGLIVENEIHKVSGLEGAIDSARLDALISAAVRQPREFDEAARAILLYAANPLPGPAATMILETLELYHECLSRDSPIRYAPTLHDAIRTVADQVVRSRVSGDLNQP